MLLSLKILLAFPLTAQWEPDQIYREYQWKTPADHHEAYLRVGGRYGYAVNPGQLPDSLQDGDQLMLPAAIDLVGGGAVAWNSTSRTLRIKARLPDPERRTNPDKNTLG